jgi:hypothetical protein
MRIITPRPSAHPERGISIARHFMSYFQYQQPEGRYGDEARLFCLSSNATTIRVDLDPLGGASGSRGSKIKLLTPGQAT